MLVRGGKTVVPDIYKELEPLYEDMLTPEVVEPVGNRGVVAFVLRDMLPVEEST